MSLALTRVSFPPAFSAIGDIVVSTGGNEAGGTAASTAKILLVDDEDLLRRSMLRVLSRVLPLARENFLEACNVASGIQVFDANQDLIRAVFTDMRMPDGFGLEVYDHVRRHSERTPVVFRSGGMPNDVRDELNRILARDTRAKFYLKPDFPVHEIVSWLRGIWGGELT